MKNNKVNYLINILIYKKRLPTSKAIGHLFFNFFYFFFIFYATQEQEKGLQKGA